jgi:histidinol-phosphate aminotransferase
VSQTNFIFVNVGEKSDEITQGLLESGFIIRGGLKPGWVRITMGQKEDNKALRNVLKKLL